MVDDINKILDQGTQSTGTTTDIANDEAFDSNLWKKYYPDKNLDKSTNSIALAKMIKDAVGYFYDNEAEVVKLIVKFKTKALLSAVSAAFQRAYGEKMGDFIVEHIDQGNNLEQISNHVKSLPNK
ncbi:MAG: hypothetical protein UV51_C0007G0035 [Candidatus Woesebacteria bacterium GW2011_GWC1_42_9]|nr:MAG: hypothetical protein UV51_C0007G0035 [Candidatus Woesebacteria bacterium GW2011_GWC1_42_9]